MKAFAEAHAYILAHAEIVERHGDEIRFACPSHRNGDGVDANPSFDYHTLKRAGVCRSCGFKGGAIDVARALGWHPTERKPGRPRRIVVPYDYKDESGALLFQVVRYEPKDFRQRRPHPERKGEWVWDLKGVRLVVYRLPELLTADPDQIVYIVEGEKDVETIRGRGLVGTCNPMGASNWRPEYSDALAGRAVVIIADKDDVGRKHANQVAQSLLGKAQCIKRIELPGDGVKDATDYFNAGGTVEELKKLVADAAEYESVGTTDPAEGSIDDDRPEIHNADRDFAKIIDETWVAIDQRNRPPWLFRRGGVVCRICDDEQGEPSICVVDADLMREYLARMIRWYKNKKHELPDGTSEIVKKDTKAPYDVARTLLAGDARKLPMLSRVIRAPILKPRGGIVEKEGYDPETCCWFAPKGLKMPALSVQPSAEEIRAARNLYLVDLLGDFPFVDQADRANSLAFFLLPFVREVIDGPTPLHLFEKPTTGSGASLLVEAMGLIVRGGPPVLMVEGSDEDEWRKRITSTLLRGTELILQHRFPRDTTSLFVYTGTAMLRMGPARTWASSCG